MNDIDKIVFSHGYDDGGVMKRFAISIMSSPLTATGKMEDYWGPMIQSMCLVCDSMNYLRVFKVDFFSFLFFLRFRDEHASCANNAQMAYSGVFDGSFDYQTNESMIVQFN